MTRARDLSNLIGSGNYLSETLTATAGQTAFTVTNGYTPGFIQVFMNGLLLDPGVDFTATTSPTVTLTTAANAGDELEVIKYNTFSVGDAITQADADTRYVNVSGDTMSGPLVVDGAVTLNSSVDGVSISRGSSHPNNYEGGRVTLKNGSGYTKQYGIDTYYENFRVFREDSNGTNSAVRFEIDSAGRVTMPYQPAFVAYNAPATLTNNAVIVWDTTVLNRGSVYNTSNGRFTAPVAGLYQFFASVRIENSVGTASYHRVSFRHNGSDIIWSKSRLNPRTVTGYYSHAASDQIIGMSAGDYVDVKFEANFSSCSTSARTEHVFYGYLIG